MEVEKLKHLQLFIEQCKENPAILADPSIAFFRDYLESLGAKLPAAAYGREEQNAKNTVVDEMDEDFDEEEFIEKTDATVDDEIDDEIIESDVELEGEVVKADNDPPQKMGDPSVEVTDENRDAAQEAKGKAMEELSEGRVEEAVEHLTVAISCNPTSAIMYATRASVYIKMKKPNAAIRDATAALEINPNSAKGYKSRGIALAMLGKWGEAAKDLHVASKLDYDEEIGSWLKKVEPNAHKIEEHRRKYDRLRKEREGSGPRYQAASREEILGEQLTDEEVKELVKSCIKTRRQLNIGRDGLTHNMLENIHAHWKRRRVCKIKCKGVCTVDMDNVRQQLEEKTGGKIIYSKGGVVFLFRGRNYNYRTRPRYPLMLWKPPAPVYPRLVQRVPEGLTLEEATEMRKKSRQLPPICKLGKNGVYCNLVNRVKEAFEACELVRINCMGMNTSDCRKIGAKLKDLVPCVLISFEFEHILIWRGKDWKSSLPPLEDNQSEVAECMTADETTSSNADQDTTNSEPGPNFLEQLSTQTTEDMALNESRTEGSGKHMDVEQSDKPLTTCSIGSSDTGDLSGLPPDKNFSDGNISDHPVPSFLEELCKSESMNAGFKLEDDISSPETEVAFHVNATKLQYNYGPSGKEDSSRSNIRLDMDAIYCIPSRASPRPTRFYLERVLILLKEAIEGGNAVILNDASLDPDIVYERSVALAKTAPSGPKFQHRVKKAAILFNEEKKRDNKEQENMDIEIPVVSDKKKSSKKKPKTQRMDNLSQILPDVVPHGSLQVDELAKLLA